MTMPTTTGFKAVEAIGRTLPDVEITTTWGSPALKADRDALIEDDPDIYYLKDHYVGYPCVLARLSRIRRDALRDLVVGAHRFMTAKGRKPSGSGTRRRGSRASNS
jgi:hypothetical protein